MSNGCWIRHADEQPAHLQSQTRLASYDFNGQRVIGIWFSPPIPMSAIDNSSSTPTTKVLTSTNETQGHRRNDFCFAPEGEIVRFASECDGERIDGSCGCRRSMAGIDSDKATTTVTVAELPITRDEAIRRLREGYRRSWNGFDEAARGELESMLDPEIDELLRIADAFPTGTVLEKRGDEFAVRQDH